MTVLSNDSFTVFAKTCLQKGSGTSVPWCAKATERAHAKQCSDRMEEVLAVRARGSCSPRKGQGHVLTI